MFKFIDVFLCIFYVFCLTVCVFGQAVFPEDDNSCFTSRREPGQCVDIRKCNYMVKLLSSNSRNPEVISYLQKSTCGFAGRYPMICCPNSNAPNVRVDNNGKEETSIFPRRPHCGLSNVTNSRIVGGAPAVLNEFPFMVILGYRNSKNPNTPKWLCGGTLITTRHVLTAAHCVHNRNDLYLARLGELTLFDEKDGASPEDIKIISVKKHENFNTVEFTNDIAILTLEHEPTKASIWPICLPLTDPLRKDDFVGEVGIIAGWGSLYFDGPRSSTLQVADIPVISEENCQRSFGKDTVIDNRIICAGWTNSAKDSCQGDSGGPLMYAVKEGKYSWYYQIGIISYGFRCAEQGYPGVFTKITNFLDWIKNNVA
ncbi:unnamed protein product [Psylliodes chrysocephalus]|uniref:CLIP domain-containing serine protease n=1 Tax=Psylliodes chrysocephalus TaxID=3402493 RepID=A0A9P0G5X7_9CUCU|nr:unnamed protein product [Psylliodes chrysocephala]